MTDASWGFGCCVTDALPSRNAAALIQPRVQRGERSETRETLGWRPTTPIPKPRRGGRKSVTTPRNLRNEPKLRIPLAIRLPSRLVILIVILIVIRPRPTRRKPMQRAPDSERDANANARPLCDYEYDHEYE